MKELILFGAFPYVAFAIAIVGGILRYYRDRFSYSSVSSQLLENNTLLWGSVLWHYGILVVLLAHLIGGVLPGLSRHLLAIPSVLFALEMVGLTTAFFSLFGIAVLILRRLISPRLRVTTSVMDWVLLGVLAVQVASGVIIALTYRWGSLWYSNLVVPWFWSIAHFNPHYAQLYPLPGIVKFHAFCGFLLIALFPFTRLVHIFTVPITYLWRPFQVVIWNTGVRPK
jgi:nitrate reductase gamma subunit